MKKLMIATAAAALVGSAFANPLVYDFKASVKYLYLTKKNYKAYDKQTYSIYYKFQKQTALKGYLIQDADGATSQSLYTPLSGFANTTSSATAFDYGRNRAFLVVMSGSAESGFKQPKILPAVLDAKFMDTAFGKPHSATSGLAEGTLFIGGDAIPCVRPQLDFLEPLSSSEGVNSVASRAGDVQAAEDNEDPEAAGGYYQNYKINNLKLNGTLNHQPPLVPMLEGQEDAGGSLYGSYPGMVALSDYVWTSVYLFGRLNGPNWFGKRTGVMPFAEFETGWNSVLPRDLARYENPYADAEDLVRWAWREGSADEYFTYIFDSKDPEDIADLDGEISFAPFFHDTWMNGAGFGKYVVPGRTKSGDVCCGDNNKINIAYRAILDSLNGNLKGGLFICTDNGIDAENTENYMFFDEWAYGRDGWDAQFYSTRVSSYLVGTEFQAPGDLYPFFTVDKWVADLWQDGPFEQETTDIISGTWSLKANLKFYNKGSVYEKNDLTVEEIAYLAQFNPDFPELPLYTATNYGEYELVRALKAAVVTLQPKATFINGREIYEINRSSQIGTLPVLTPQFAKYYGLANWR